ncbi:MAG: alpha/beta fold hydrolase [Halobacteriota archaeon]
MPFLEVDSGVRIFAQDWGSGKPIVFVHGWPFSHRMFEYQMLDLAQHGYRVVALDLRGYGQSDKPWEGNDYDSWANDLGSVIAALDLRDVTLAGFSMGGAIAMHYLATHDDTRVTKLALIAAAGPRMVVGPDNPKGVPREVFDVLIAGDLADRAKAKRTFAQLAFHNYPYLTLLQLLYRSRSVAATATVDYHVSEELSSWFEQMGMEASPRASVRGLEELRDRDLRKELSAIRVPTRIFHGVHDRVVPFALGAEEQQRLIDQAKVIRFEDSGHGIFYQEKDKLNEELIRFFA